MPAAKERAHMKVLGEVDGLSSDTKLPLRSSLLVVGLSGSCIKGASAVESSPAMLKMFGRIHNLLAYRSMNDMGTRRTQELTDGLGTS